MDKTEAQTRNDSVFNSGIISRITLHDVAADKIISINTKQNAKPLTLYVFLSPECPLCQNYSLTLNDIFKQYSGNMQMYGIVPGKAYTIDEVRKFTQQYKILFPLMIDTDEKLTSYLQANVTPQVILLNDKDQLVYKGAIDNWVQSLGKQRVNITEFFLKDALQQSINNSTVLLKRTKAVGCRINDY